MNPTGDKEMDDLRRAELEKELARISRNAERRVAREKAKGKPITSPAGGAGSPGGPSDADGAATDGTPQKGNKRGKQDGTMRKCANCGQVGHIKTNRKSVTFHCIFCNDESYDPEPVFLRDVQGVASPAKRKQGTAGAKRDAMPVTLKIGRKKNND